MTQGAQAIWHFGTRLDRASDGAAVPAPATFSARYCDDHNCRLDEFESAVLRDCLARRARLLFAVMRGAKFFAADRELILAVAQAVAMNEVREAIDEYWSHPANRRWLRRVAGLRVSTSRLRRLASEYLPLTNSTSRPRRLRIPTRLCVS